MDILNLFFLVRVALVAAISLVAFALVRRILRTANQANAAGKPVAPFPVFAVVAQGAVLAVLVVALGFSSIYNPKRNLSAKSPSSAVRQSEAADGWRQGMERAVVTPPTNAPTPRTNAEVLDQTRDAAQAIKDGFLTLPNAQD